MNKNNFEGSLVLEKLAERGLLDDFYEAIDSDDFESVHSMLSRADFDAETIAVLLQKLAQSDGFDLS